MEVELGGGERPVIIGGALNAHNEAWGDSRTTKRGRELQQTLDGTDLTVANNGEATFLRTGVEGSVIDLTMASAVLHLCAKPQPDGWGSDHAPIIVGRPPEPPSKTCRVVDWAKYQADVAALRAQGLVLDFQTIAEALGAATRTVQVPTTRPNPDFQWLLLRAQRRRAQGRARRTRLPEDKAAFRRSDALFKRHGRQAGEGTVGAQVRVPLSGQGGTTSAWRMDEDAGQPTPPASHWPSGWTFRHRTLSKWRPMRSSPRPLCRRSPPNAHASALPQAVRVGPRYKVPLQITTYADDVAIWVSDHGGRRRFVQDKLQHALTSMDALSLTLSAPKSMALYNGPHRTFDLTLTINGRPLDVRREATYLGLRVVDRVTWEAAVRDALRGARTTTNILRLLEGARRGTEQRMMLQLYRGLTLARVLYALPLLALTEHQWGRIEQAQREAL
ncbi:hypothetical protein HPB47_026040 [Ixodes persulcatus]|uniref:Uncharacterized protein n=1 Tax=Ixodes persulcatus TaxID=34615 RepID=A0AC60PZR9_IXOPE|nr:hypothetical protein HPB47_026040 [Ixodes persulcatus]